MQKRETVSVPWLVFHINKYCNKSRLKSLLSLEVRGNTYPNSYCMISRWSQEGQPDPTPRHSSHFVNRSSKPFLIWRKVRWYVFRHLPFCPLMLDFTLFFSKAKTNVFSHKSAYYLNFLRYTSTKLTQKCCLNRARLAVSPWYLQSREKLIKHSKTEELIFKSTEGT